MEIDIVSGLLFYVVFLFAVTLHEAAHAWTAMMLGDPTAYQGGQGTLDPRPHIRREPFGMARAPADLGGADRLAVRVRERALQSELGDAVPEACGVDGTRRPGVEPADGVASVDPAGGSVTASWTIRFVTDSSMADGVSFLLNGRLVIDRLEADGLVDFTSAPRREGSDWNLVELRFDPPLPPGETREVRFAYAGVLYGSLPSDPINDISPGWIELGLDAAWAPVFASLDQYLTGRLVLTIPGEWTVTASGDVTHARPGDGAGAGTGARSGEDADEVHTIVNRVPQIDFAFVAAPRLELSGTSEVAVYHESTDAGTIDRVVDAALQCRDWLESRFGDLPDLKLVLAPRDDGGYARKNCIVLVRVDDYSAPDLSRFLCHELAHFWSSAPSASTHDYWMTEAFAELVSAHHIRDVYGDSAYSAILAQWSGQSADLPPVWTDTAAERGSFAINYRKGPLLLSRLEGAIGRESFAEFLALYMTQSTPTTPVLLDKLETVAGREARDRFRAALAEGS